MIERIIRKWPFALLVALLAFVLNVAIRGESLASLSFINEDSALIVQVGDAQADSPTHLLELLWTSYGPRVIRPWQLWGMHIEQNVLGLSALQSVLVGIALFSIALACLADALRRLNGPVAAWIAVLLVGGSTHLTEPLLWLSDRHDVYLILFSSLVFWVTALFLTQKLSSIHYVLLSGVLTFAAFLSNEKATVVPAIMTVLSALVVLTSAGTADRPVRKVWIVAATSGASTLAYFLFRFSVLGVFLGGYDDRVLPEGGLTLDHSLNVLKSVVTAPLFGQFNNVPMLIWGELAAFVAFFGLVVVALSQRYGLRVVPVLLLAHAALVLAAIPTLRSFTGDMPGHLDLGTLGVLNMRVYLVVHVLLGGLLAAGFGLVFQHWRSPTLRAAALALAAIFIVSGLHEARLSSEPFAKAGRFTREAVALHRQRCACADLEAGQSKGIPPSFAGVNSFTEPVWLDWHAHRLGTPACLPASPRCELVFEALPEGGIRFAGGTASRTAAQAP